ncbi:hypothetical protein V8C37DRAFT_410622 [Trichoderma ceciliae]
MVADAAVSKDGLFIPLIDFSKFLNGDSSTRRETAKAILNGFQDAGFVYLKNHPIAQETVQHAFTMSANFFAQPLENKMALGWTTPQANRGYVAHGREKVTNESDIAEVEKIRSAVPDLKESYEIGRDDAAGHPNNWPVEEGTVTGFKADMKGFFEECKALHVEVMRAIATGMGFEENFFDGFVDVGDNNLRLLHYPAVKSEVFSIPGQVRAGEHSDYGSITLLFQDDRGGLQVKSPNGNFVDATPIEGSIVVNAGDLLARWSNDTIKSTIHRVVEPPRKEGEMYPSRYSIAYFCNPNFKDTIEALPGTYATEQEKKYDSIKSGDYLVQRLTATHTAGSEIDSCDGDIEAFFARNGCDGRTRDACDEYARARFPGLEATPSPTQGYCSYTLNMSDDCLLQFRPEAFMLDIDTCSQVHAIYGKFAPTSTYLGTVQGIPLQTRDTKVGSSVMHAYLHKRIRGVPLSEFRRRKKGCEADGHGKIYRRRLMSGLAKVLALGFRGRQPWTRQTALLKGRIGESMRWRLKLLDGLPGEDLLRHVSEAQGRLDSVEASDWCLTHGDLLPGNIMVDAETGRLTGLIDWAEAEWLPFGMALYGVEEALGEDVPSQGFKYYEDHEELRQLFWKKFLSFATRGESLATELRLGDAEASRKLGILLWRGIAFDDGRMDRAVEAGRDDSEIQKLRLFLNAPSSQSQFAPLASPKTLSAMAPSENSASRKPPSSAIRNGYLVLYNAASAMAWGLVLQSTVAALVRSGPQTVFLATGEFTKWTQTAAALEILHSLLGVVRSPLFTTLMQVASRFLLVWGILFLYPYLAIQSPTYSSMLIAWSVTEVIRYSYFALSLSGLTPRALTWLRYHTFFVLYPIGILSECSLVYLAAVGPAATATEYPLTLMPYVLYGILVIYVPGAYVLYTYMMAQRRKVLRSLKTKDEKATQ